MGLLNGKNSHLVTGIIVLLSIAGIAWFGYRAVKENLYPDRDNPYEVDISKYEAQGSGEREYRETVTLPISLEAPAALAVGPANEIVLGGADSIMVLDSSGSIQASFGAGGQVYALAVGKSGRIYAGVEDHMEVYEDGVLLNRWESLGEQALITSIAAAEGRIYIADAGGRAVWVFSADGRLMNRVAGNPGFVIPSPYFDIAVDSGGYLWAVNTGEHRLESYDAQGNFNRSWGSYSLKIEDFCGCCNPTHFTFLPDGNFVTAEKGIPRIKVCDAQGMLVNVVALAGQFDEGTAGLDLAAGTGGRVYVLDPVRKQVRIFEEGGIR